VLAFITCSVLDEEGADRIAAFLDRHQGWQAEAVDIPLGRPQGAGMRLTPHHDGTDGFFVAILRSA
jgi:16S rRNA (cytosine967-C5)-methyltransferase